MPSHHDDDYTLSIPKQELAQLPAAHFTGEIRLIDHLHQVADAVSVLNSETVVGFDTETRPSFKRGQNHQVSLMQISTHTCCFLFRLNKIGIPESLKQFLENPSILKIGVSLHDDFHNLHRKYTVKPEGFIDLQPFVKNYKIADNSLSRIYGIIFGQRISKGQRLTNWEADTLTPAQQAYAAFDALSCIHIYESLTNGHFNPAQSPHKVWPETTDSHNGACTDNDEKHENSENPT